MSLVIASDDESEDMQQSSINSKSPVTLKLTVPPRRADEEVEFTEGDSDSGQACADNDIRSCMHTYTSSPPLIAGRERKKRPKAIHVADSSDEKPLISNRSSRKSAVAARQKFKELFLNHGDDTSADEGTLEVSQFKSSPSPKKSVATGSNAKMKHMNVDALTTSETVGNGQRSRGNGKRHIMSVDEDESGGEEEWQEPAKQGGEEEISSEEVGEEEEDEPAVEKPIRSRRSSGRRKQSSQSNAALQELKNRRGQSDLEVGSI